MRVNFQKILGFFAIVVTFNIIANTVAPIVIFANEYDAPTSYPIEETRLEVAQEDAVVRILPESLGYVDGNVCGLGNAFVNDGLEVTIQNWYEGYSLQGSYYEAGGEFSSWMSLIGFRNSRFNISETNATYFLPSDTDTPEGPAGFQIRIVDAEGNVVSNVDSLEYTVITDPESSVCGGEPHQSEVHTISGSKLGDANNNSLPDESDTKLAGWTIKLYSQNDNEWSFLWQEVTDENGEYFFSELAAGSYYVCEVNQNGWTQVYPNVMNAGVTNTVGSSNEAPFCYSVEITEESPLNIMHKDFVNVSGRATINVMKRLLDQNGADTSSSEVFSVDLYSNGSRVNTPTQFISDSNLNPQTAQFIVVPGTYNVVEAGLRGYANLGCKVINDNDDMFTLADGDIAWVRCDNQMIDFIPTVTISPYPLATVSLPNDIVLTATGSGGNGMLSYMWFCDTGMVAYTQSITLSGQGRYTCVAAVYDEDGDYGNTSGIFTINAKPNPVVNPTGASSSANNGATQPESNPTPETTPDEQVPPDEGISTSNPDNESVLGSKTQVCDIKSPASGYVFVDANQNDIKDGEESGVSDVDLSLMVDVIDDDGSTIQVELAKLKTNTIGRWETNLCPGTYKLKVDTADLPEASSVLGDDTFEFSVGENEPKENVNFGVRQVTLSANTNWWLFLIPLVILVLAAGGYAIYSTNQKRKV